jgi:hypothetical protein
VSLSRTVFGWKPRLGVFGVPSSGAVFVLPLWPAEYTGQPSVGVFGVWFYRMVFFSHESYMSYESHGSQPGFVDSGVPLSRTVFKNCFRCSSPRSARAGSEIHRPRRTTTTPNLKIGHFGAPLSGAVFENVFLSHSSHSSHSPVGHFGVRLSRIHFFTMKIMKEMKSLVFLKLGEFRVSLNRTVFG